MFSKHPLKHKKKETISQDSQTTALTSPDQINLDICKEDKKMYFDMKRKIKKFEVTIDALPYWKNAVTIWALVSSIVFNGLLFYIIIQHYKDIPQTFPLFYSQASKSWAMFDKETLIMIPIVFSLLTILNLKLNHSTYSFDKRLSIVINIGFIVTNLLGMIAFGELFSLVLIY